MARAARKAKAKPAGKRAPASGKQRKYSRDNNGRFASTGTGATARGGRLLTAKGNKRQTQTITAAGQKGVLAKPKGLKPGSIANSAAKRREANSIRKGNRVLTTDADRTSRKQSLATAERALAAVKASPGKGRNRLTGSDSELKAAQGRVDGLKGPLPNSRKVNRSAQAAANRDALAIKRSERRSEKTMADFTARKATSKPAAKPAAKKPAAKPAAKKPAAAAKPVAKKPKASETQRGIRSFMDQNRGSVARDYKRDAQAFRQPLAKKDQTPGGPKTVGGALEALASKSFNKVKSKTALTSAESERAIRLIGDNNIKGYRVTRSSYGDVLERTNSVGAKSASLGEAAASRSASRKPAKKPAVSARGRTAPKPAARTTPSSADGKLSFRSRRKAAAAQRTKTSQIQEKTTSQVIGAQRGVKRTAAAGHRSEKVAVTKVASKQGNLLTGKTETTKHVKARIVPKSGGAAPNSKGRRRSFGVMTRKMETPRSNLGRKKQRLRGIDAARAKKSPYDKKKAAKTLATRGKAMKYYDSING